MPALAPATEVFQGAVGNTFARLFGGSVHPTEVAELATLHLLDTIRSRGLMTRRNRSASVIEQESVMVLRV